MFRILYILFFVFTVANCKGPEVITALGNVEGYLKTSFEGKTFSAFEGIPYAKPPIGDLRFELAQPAEPWTGTWNATTLHECLQIGLSNEITGLEDCLYVNVYVPREQPLHLEDIDVIAHIHGGGFVIGSPHSFTSPDYLMDRNVIFVSFTYRLGIFGFLSTEDDVVPGNNGLKDQTLALKWIQDNIKYFGGNPNSVTLTGFSAGAASSHFHYLSPSSRGLFQRGVSHSGTAINAWSIQNKPLETAKRISAILGCPIESTKEMVKCLKERPGNEILYKIPQLYNSLFFALHFAPVVDKDFLPTKPMDLLLKGDVPDVPWIFSNAIQDGLFPGIFFAEILEHVEENWNDLAPTLLKYHTTHPESSWNEIAKAIKNHYLGQNEKFDPKNYVQFIKLLSDRFFLVDGERAAKLQAKVSKSSVYYYLFNYLGGSTFTDLVKPDAKDEHKGIGHGDDILQIYGNVIPNNKPTEDDIKIKNILLELLVSFARTGVPRLENLDWKPTEYNELTYLNITSPTELSVITRKSISEVEFWDQYDETANSKQKEEL